MQIGVNVQSRFGALAYEVSRNNAIRFLAAVAEPVDALVHCAFFGSVNNAEFWAYFRIGY